MSVEEYFFNGKSTKKGQKGYPLLWVQELNRSVYCHTIVWEYHNGAVPKGHDIHHKDFNKLNFNISNLELLTKSDHMKLHAGWKKTNGVWTHRTCNSCEEVLLLERFYFNKSIKGNYTYSACCKSCHNIKAMKNHNQRKNK